MAAMKLPWNSGIVLDEAVGPIIRCGIFQQARIIIYVKGLQKNVAMKFNRK